MTSCEESCSASRSLSWQKLCYYYVIVKEVVVFDYLLDMDPFYCT